MAVTIINEPAFTAEDAPRLAKTDLTQCTLLMNIGPHQLAYALQDPQDQTFISVKGYFFDTGTAGHSLIEILEQCFDHNKILFTAFHNTRISFDTPEFSLIPSDLYDPALKREYLRFLHPDHPGYVLMYDQINSQKAVNVFGADKNVAGYLKKEFPSARFYHAQTAFLCSLIKYEPQDERRAYIRVLTDSVIITILESGKLLMMQNYPIFHSTDALYFTVNALRQLHLPAGSTRIFLSGEIEDDAPLYLELLHGLSAVSWLKRPEGFHYVQAFTEYPDHYFYNLISLATCE